MIFFTQKKIKGYGILGPPSRASLAFHAFDVYSFVIEGHLVEWLFQLKVYTSLNIV